MNQIMWAVDLPNPKTITISGEWVNMDYFGTRRAAVEWVVNNVGIPKKHAGIFVSKVQP